MSKISGLCAGLVVDQFNIASGTAALNGLNSSQGMLTATGIDKKAVERLRGLASGSLSMQVHFDPDEVHLAVKDLPPTARIVTACFPQGAGEMSATLTSVQANYGLNRTADGGLGGPVSFSSTGGLPVTYGRQLSAYLEAFTTPTDTPSLDLTGSSTGGTLIVHCTEFTGTDVTIDLEESSDDGAGDAFAAVPGSTLTFTGVGSQRVDLPSLTAVEQFVRAAVAGTFTTATLLIVFAVGTLD